MRMVTLPDVATITMIYSMTVPNRRLTKQTTNLSLDILFIIFFGTDDNIYITHGRLLLYRIHRKNNISQMEIYC